MWAEEFCCQSLFVGINSLTANVGAVDTTAAFRSRRGADMRLLIAAGLLMICSILAEAAIAKPKIVSNGCTAAQIQSPSASSCIDQMESDIIHNRPTTHAVYCSSTGKILCCAYDGNGQVVDHSCTVVGLRRPLEGLRAPTTNGVVAPQ